MKKATLLLALFFLGSTLKMAHAFQLPVDRDGAYALTVQDVGVEVFLSTSERAWLVNGSSQVLAPDGTVVGGSSVAIYGVLTSTFSGDANSYAYVQLRATNTANTSSELLVPPIAIGKSSSTTGTLHYPTNNLVIFDPPIVAADMVSVNISSALGALTTYRYNAAIFWRWVATNTPEDTWIPQDQRSGIKVPGGASFYGVKPSSDSFGVGGGVANDNQGTEELDFGSGSQLIMTSSIPANQSTILMYGWEASSGNLSTWFDVDAATGLANYRLDPASIQTASFTALPQIYPRTFGLEFPWQSLTPIATFTTPMSSSFSFPWPIKLRGGARFTPSVNTERFRLKTRNARALR